MVEKARYKYETTLIHSLLWITLFSVNYALVSKLLPDSQAISRSLMMMVTYMIIFYLFWFVFVPKFYVNKRYAIFWFYTAISIIFGSIIRYKISIHYEVIPISLKRVFTNHNDIRTYIISFFATGIMAGISILIRIFSLYALQSDQKEELLKQKTEAELQLLKAQINPHFLFNSLNNIYALVITKNEKAADSLMSLSQLLRYVIYESVFEKVPLDKEIQYLKFYLELESLRLPDPSKLKTEINIEPNPFNIVPMIFVPFIENAFKHGNISQDGEILLTINLHQNMLHFSCINSVGTTKKSKDGVGGIGVVNTKKRLELLYPDKFKLDIKLTDNDYRVNLMIEL